jgi:hypothetical protein
MATTRKPRVSGAAKFGVTDTVIDEDNGWNELVAEIQTISELGPAAHIGFPEGRGLETRRVGERSSILERAVVNEFGNPAKRVPKRPFLRYTFNKEQAKWIKELDDAASTLPIAGAGPPLSQAFHRVVAMAVEATKKNVEEWSKPRNAPATVARKGFNDPLFETGAMGDAIQAQLELIPGRGSPRPQALAQPRKRAQKRGRVRHTGRGNKSFLAALGKATGRWKLLGSETAFRAPGKSASKKATATRFVPKIKYRRAKV